MVGGSVSDGLVVGWSMFCESMGGFHKTRI